jgi:hypothetical protein
VGGDPFGEPNGQVTLERLDRRLGRGGRERLRDPLDETAHAIDDPVGVQAVRVANRRQCWPWTYSTRYSPPIFIASFSFSR